MKQYKGFLVDDDYNIYNARTGRKLKPHKGTDGYLQVLYREPDGKTVHERVHVIIGHLFVDNPNPEHLKYINHIDSDKTNCSLDNLEWVTNSQNVKHGWHSGNRTHKNNTAVRAIKDGCVYEFSSIRKLAKELHLDRHKVARILKGELPKDYLEYEFEYI